MVSSFFWIKRATLNYKNYNGKFSRNKKKNRPNSRDNIYQTNGLHSLLHFYNGTNDCSQKFDIVTDIVLIVHSHK